MEYRLEKAGILDKTCWLVINPEKYDSGKSLYHVQFFKSFSLENTAGIRAATLHIISDLYGMLRVNGHWVNQAMDTGKLSRIDLTGYLDRGENHLMLDFPYVKAPEVFAAALETEYYNDDKVWLVTDTTWTTAIQYKIPAPWDPVKTRPVVLHDGRPAKYEALQITPFRYKLSFNPEQLKEYPNVYLRMTYDGNKAQCRRGERLVADNFNNGTTWSINLKDHHIDQEGRLIFEFEPLARGYQIYFEKLPDTGSPGSVTITSISLQPEYRDIIQIRDED